MDFKNFKTAVAKQFEMMSKHELFRVDVDKDELWTLYLAAYPEGSNPIYKERTEHDCTCCKQFIRAVGDVVAIINGKMVSIWDVTIPEEPAYQTVTNCMSLFVRAKPIKDVFFHYEKTAGTDKSFQQLIDHVDTWYHFFVNIPAKFVMKNSDIAGMINGPRADHDVLLRSLNELTDEAVITTLDLIAQNSLYRGEEHKFAVEVFNKLKKDYNKLKTVQDKDAFVWLTIKTAPASVCRIRNTAIGSLLVDLSEGKNLEAAVGSFEAKVAPTSYKRPTALITKKMIEEAKEKLAELGLTSALDRRYATINDISINNILFANREARKVINGDVFDDLVATKTKKANLDKVEEVSIEKFIKDILPTASSLEVMMENSHSSNLVSLIAPVDPTAGNLFKWDNKFSWSYNGEMADSIKERVKKAGGNITGDLCCRLAWNYTDDLDFHMTEPRGGHVYFGTRSYISDCGGKLDVDANGGSGMMQEPVENIFYEKISRMQEGVYVLYVNNWSRRSSGVGFEVEIDILGDVHSFNYEHVVGQGKNVQVAKLKYSKANGIEIIESLPSSKAVKTVWGISTNSFSKANVVMMSPNYWDGNTSPAVGNKHYFFMLDGCVNDGTVRGFYNEFLKEELNQHRKVFEAVGSKMTVGTSAEQLSGLGFSSTQKNSLICRVKGSFTRIIKIVF